MTCTFIRLVRFLVVYHLVLLKGFKVVAMTGRVEQHKSYLTSLGASAVIDRKEYEGKPKPLSKMLYAGRRNEELIVNKKKAAVIA